MQNGKNEEKAVNGKAAAEGYGRGAAAAPWGSGGAGLAQWTGGTVQTVQWRNQMTLVALQEQTSLGPETPVSTTRRHRCQAGIIGRPG